MIHCSPGVSTSGEIAPEQVGKLGEIFEQPAVLRWQFESAPAPPDGRARAALSRSSEAGFVKMFVIARQAAVRAEVRSPHHVELRQRADMMPPFIDVNLLRARPGAVGVPGVPSVL